MLSFPLNCHYSTDHTALHAAFSNRNEAIRTMIIEVNRNGDYRCRFTSLYVVKCFCQCIVVRPWTRLQNLLVAHISSSAQNPFFLVVATNALLVPGWRVAAI